MFYVCLHVFVAETFVTVPEFILIIIRHDVNQVKVAVLEELLCNYSLSSDILHFIVLSEDFITQIKCAGLL